MNEEYPVKKPKLLSTPGTQESAMTTFIEPFSFSESQRERLEQLLRQLRISDDEGHRLLIAATEYEIALCRDSASRYLPPPPPADTPAPPENSDPREQPLATAALALATQLRQAPPELRLQITSHLSRSDPLGRDYGDRFLECLPDQLARIAAACGGPATPVEEAAVDTPPEVLPDFVQSFILQMAEIYYECLEAEPTAAGRGPFISYMEQITAYGEIPFARGPAQLQALLDERQ